MAERAADLRSGVAFLRQRRLILLAAAGVGLGLGMLYASVVPPQLGSTSLVLLRGAGASGSADSSDIDTQVRIVLSIPVLQQAGASVTPALSATQVMDRIDVQGATSQIISIEAFSSRASQAQALSQAVAEAYLDTVGANARSITGETIGALQTRDADLTQQMKALAGRIDGLNKRTRGEDPKSAAGVQDAQLLDRLTADQSDLALQREKVREDLAASQQATGASDTASIVQPGAPATGPDRLQRLVLWALGGALVAAVCVAGLLLIKLRRDPHLRARDDVADAVGSGVLADVRSRPQRSVAAWTALFETYEASPVDAWAFRQVLRALAAAQPGPAPGRTAGKRSGGRLEHPPSITIITLSGDRQGIAVAPQLAAFAASLGMATRFVVATGHDSAPSLWAACAAERGTGLRPGLYKEAWSDGPPPAVNGTLGPLPATFDEILTGVPSRPSPAEPADLADNESVELQPSSSPDADAPDDEASSVEGQTVGAETTPSPEPLPSLHVVPKHPPADLTIVLAVADRREPTLRQVPPTAATALAISPGVGTREELARLAVAVDDAGQRIDGIVIADPDASDRTTGRRTLDERARQAPLPLRTTGIGQVSPSDGERGHAR